MDYFLTNKYQPLDENVLFASKIILELVNDKKHLDELFADYAKTRNIALSLNMERILYLAISFLYALGRIRLNNNIVMRI